MAEENKQIDRQTLYEEVWSEPVTIVARRYGLSDVGFAKICRKLSVPLPSRGYWAKVKAGNIMKRAPLPKVGGHRHIGVTLTRLDPAELNAQAVAKQEARKIRESVASVTVPAVLAHPHPLVRAAERRLK